MMRATGKIQRMDDLGRIVIPHIVRQKLGLSEGTPMEIFYDEREGSVCFKKYTLYDAASEESKE